MMVPRYGSLMILVAVGHLGPVLGYAALNARHGAGNQALRILNNHEVATEEALYSTFGAHHNAPFEQAAVYDELENDHFDHDSSPHHSGIRGYVKHINSEGYIAPSTSPDSESEKGPGKGESKQSPEMSAENIENVSQETITQSVEIGVPTVSPAVHSNAVSAAPTVRQGESAGAQPFATMGSNNGGEGPSSNEIEDLPLPGRLNHCKYSTNEPGMLTMIALSICFVKDPVKLPLIAFQYYTTATWNLPDRDEIELHEVTQTLFKAILKQEFGDSIEVDIISYGKLAPRVFNFVVVAYFNNSDDIPPLGEMENKFASLLHDGEPFNTRYLEMLKHMDSTIFETSFSVRFINNQHDLDKAIQGEILEDPDEDDDGHDHHRLFILLLVVAALVLLLVFFSIYWYCRNRRSRTAPYLEDFDSRDFETSKDKTSKKESSYSTANFSKDGIGKRTRLASISLEAHNSDGTLSTTNNHDLEEVPLFDEKPHETPTLNSGKKKQRQVVSSGKPPRHPSSAKNVVSTFETELFKNQQSSGYGPQIPQRMTRSTTSHDQSRTDDFSSSSSLSESRASLFDSDSNVPLSSSRSSLHDSDSAVTPSHPFTTSGNESVGANQVISPTSAQIQDIADEMDDEDFDSLPSVKERMAMLKANLSQSTGDEQSNSGVSARSRLHLPKVVDVQEKIQGKRRECSQAPAVDAGAEAVEKPSPPPKIEFSNTEPIEHQNIAAPNRHTAPDPGAKAEDPWNSRGRSEIQEKPYEVPLPESGSESKDLNAHPQYPLRTSRPGSPAMGFAASAPAPEAEPSTMPEWMRKFHEMGLAKADS